MIYTSEKLLVGGYHSLLWQNHRQSMTSASYQSTTSQSRELVTKPDRNISALLNMQRITASAIAVIRQNANFAVMTFSARCFRSQRTSPSSSARATMAGG